MSFPVASSLTCWGVVCIRNKIDTQITPFWSGDQKSTQISQDETISTKTDNRTSIHMLHGTAELGISLFCNVVDDAPAKQSENAVEGDAVKMQKLDTTSFHQPKSVVEARKVSTGTEINSATMKHFSLYLTTTSWRRQAEQRDRVVPICSNPEAYLAKNLQEETDKITSVCISCQICVSWSTTALRLFGDRPCHSAHRSPGWWIHRSQGSHARQFPRDTDENQKGRSEDERTMCTKSGARGTRPRK